MIYNVTSIDMHQIRQKKCMDRFTVSVSFRLFYDSTYFLSCYCCTNTQDKVKHPDEKHVYIMTKSQ